MKTSHYFGGALCMLLALLSGGASAADTPDGHEKSEAARCAAVKPAVPIDFNGKKLVEIADIKEPELRLANRLIDVGCTAAATAKVDAVAARDPQNRNVKYLRLRLLRQSAGERAFLAAVQPLLNEHPDFDSLKVLLADAYYKVAVYDRVTKLLDEAAPQVPNDVQIYVMREGMKEMPFSTREIVQMMKVIARDARFPRDSRLNAVEVLKAASGSDFDAYMAAQYVAMEFESLGSRECKATDLVDMLKKLQRDEEIVAVLDSPAAVRGDCLNVRKNRVPMAMGLLLQAVKIAPEPTQGNAALVTRALEVLDGDLAPIEDKVMGTPRGDILLPFLAKLAKK